jgi:GxxExxY protein
MDFLMHISATQTHSIIGAAMEVHGLLGHGFLETVYQEALAREFEIRNIPFKREHSFFVTYKNIVLSCTYRVVFICYGEIIVELKTLASIGSIEQAQVLNYLRASGFQRALLILVLQAFNTSVWCFEAAGFVCDLFYLQITPIHGFL